jgi:hypothetical protein
LHRTEAKIAAREKLVQSLHTLLSSPQNVVPVSIRNLVKPIYEKLTELAPGASIPRGTTDRPVNSQNDRDGIIENILTLMGTPTQKLPPAARDNINSIFESLSNTPLNTRLNFSDNDDESGDHYTHNEASSISSPTKRPTPAKHSTPNSSAVHKTIPLLNNYPKPAHVPQQPPESKESDQQLASTTAASDDGDDSPIGLSVFEGLEEILAWSSVNKSTSSRMSINGSENLDSEEQHEAWKDAVYAAIVDMMTTHEDEYSAALAAANNQTSTSLAQNHNEHKDSADVDVASPESPVKRKRTRSSKAFDEEEKSQPISESPKKRRMSTRRSTSSAIETESAPAETIPQTKTKKAKSIKSKKVNSVPASGEINSVELDSDVQTEAAKKRRRRRPRTVRTNPRASPVEVHHTIPPNPPSPTPNKRRRSQMTSSDEINKKSVDDDEPPRRVTRRQSRQA